MGWSKATVPTPVTQPSLGFFDDFSQRAQGNISEQGQWLVYGGTAQINSSQQLSLSALFTSTSRGLMLNRVFSEGRIRILVDQNHKFFILSFRHQISNDARFSTWIGTSTPNNLSFGWFVGTTHTDMSSSVVGSTTIPSSTDFWVEISCSTINTGSVIEVRTWGVNQVYPSSPSFTYTLASGDPTYGEGFVSLQTTNGAGNDAIIKNVQVMDGNDPRLWIKDQVAYIGRWFHTLKNELSTMTTLNQGTEIRASVNGTRNITANFWADPNATAGEQPYIAYSIDGASFTRVCISPNLIAAPTTAPTVSASGSGSPLTAGTYLVRYTWLNGTKETTPSPEATITLTTGQDIIVTIPTLPSNATKANIYISPVNGASGTETLQGYTTLTTYTQSTVILSGAALPSINTTSVTGLVQVVLATNLTPGVHTVKIVVAAIYQYDARWVNGMGLHFQGLTVDNGAIIQPWVSGKKRGMFFGDSITDGVRLLNLSSNLSDTINGAGEQNYVHICCNQLGVDAWQVGFPGTGVTIGGNGGAPSAGTSFPYKMNGRAISEPAPNFIVVNQGTNESGVSAPTWQTAYQNYINQIAQQYPGIPIFCMRPFSGSQATQVQAVANLTANCHYVDTTSWPMTFTDTLHPDVNGSIVGGTELANFITQVLGSSFFS